MVRVNGKEVFRSEDQVLRVALLTARGEVGAAAMQPGNLQDTYVDVMVEIADPQGPLRLDQLELIQRGRESRRVEDTEFKGPRPMSPEFIKENTASLDQRPSAGVDANSEVATVEEGEDNPPKDDSHEDSKPEPTAPDLAPKSSRKS